MSATLPIAPKAPLPRGVRRALDAMRSNVSHDWSVVELAKLAGMSSRTLQRQFKAFLGKAPHTELSDMRFESARRELLQSLPDTKVMDIALRCGFPHFGRFSVEYRRRYGETPSQTLKRQALFADAVASPHSFFPAGAHRPTLSLGMIAAAAGHGEVARTIADDLTTALTRAGVSVTSEPKSSRYRLAGEIRTSGQNPRLIFRLIDSETGRHLWADRTDTMLGEDSAFEERLATRIAAALQPSLRLAEIDRAQRKPEAELSPHDLTLRAMPGVLSLDAEGNARALELLDRATEGDPNHPLAASLAAWAHVQRVVYHFTDDLGEERARSADLAKKARALAGDATALAVLGNALTLLNDLDGAKAVIRQALSIDGGSAWAWSRHGWIDLYNGDDRSAIERFKISLDLAPHDVLAFNNLVGIGCAHFKGGRYLESAYWQERALVAHPSAIWVHRTLSPAYMLGGATEDAHRSIAALQRQYPDLTVSEVKAGLPPLPQSYRDSVIEALGKAGLPA